MQIFIKARYIRKSAYMAGCISSVMQRYTGTVRTEMRDMCISRFEEYGGIDQTKKVEEDGMKYLGEAEYA